MTPDPTPPIEDPALGRLSAALGDLPKRGAPPVENWHPEHCGRIDIRIAADGTWFHEGTPIRRPALVRLFSTILRREADGSTVLVTPAERMTITVDDAPFVAVEMAVEGEGAGRRIGFRTNVDDLVPLDDAHPIRFEQDGSGGLKPYVKVRGGLWALLTRSLTYDLVELAEEREIDGRPWLGLAAAGGFHPIARSADLEIAV
ncbi:DUF1285 domain-containing protein [Methylobacterium haplocladii]|uniref:Proteophosphoglycan n=1 Tax=Methylobacterium haplocladii TaxID=1176176 RepID=A0A512IMR1_9HYPH|nr:DUF1285 domain-containing protein [Methylobacterium haplocladii]GEO99003.1 hypothetical protein MHA02_13910 [Methylobacterium haplocladii]GJD84149.1 hypothetical protein HPGCJGGD_2024 [Methylobacterium haplocladii]GLS61211.1 hypothetical protein GCM10007887_39090 [Methylobacterium haplocladii]